ncbi:hypothetical protein B2A_14484, partial [mine drainage metagenome]
PTSTAQHYAADGKPEGSAILVSSGVMTADPVSPTVAMDAEGDFVVDWASYNLDTLYFNGIYAQRYAADGEPEGSALFVSNEFPSGSLEAPVVAMDAAGDFVVAWQIYDQASGTSKWDVYAQCYAADGNPEGSAFLVNSGFTVGEQAGPVVAMDATGGFRGGLAEF